MGIFENRLNVIERLNTEIERKNDEISILQSKVESLQSQVTIYEIGKSQNEYVLHPGEYSIGVDIKPGRYYLKLVQGDNGRLEVTGRDWVISNLGSWANGISEYYNLGLKYGTKLKISGEVRVSIKLMPPINVDEDISTIERLQSENTKLKEELLQIKDKYEKIRLSHNDCVAEEMSILMPGKYYCGENIKSGLYDLEVISGHGWIKVGRQDIYKAMGNGSHEIMEYKGLKVKGKMVVEVSGNLKLKLLKKDIII